jgi:hypothetical protein
MSPEMKRAHLNYCFTYTLLDEKVFEMLAAPTKIKGIIKTDIIDDI